ncbi:uncharacterized protein [Nicotiana sylvestris]|uniref:uncharacterized protein n=1 Tax=Nicotiana sylvestris TaxID=4096 RepID=UPI00388C94D2
MDVIGLIQPTTSNGHKFIRVAIDYFTKWVEVASYKAATKKVVANFVKDRIVCRFKVPESIVTDNTANLNKAVNKNIKKILRKMVEKHKQWNEKLPFDLLGYRTTVRTSTGETPYMLVYGTEVVIPVEVEIPSLRIIQDAELSDAEWIRSCYEQLALTDGKRMNAMVRQPQVPLVVATRGRVRGRDRGRDRGVTRTAARAAPADPPIAPIQDQVPVVDAPAAPTQAPAVPIVILGL